MLALAERYRARGLRVVSTSPIDDADDAAEKTAVETAAHEEHMSYPCFLDVRSTWAHQTGLHVRPAFLVVGRDGKVAFRVAAVIAENAPEGQQLERAIVQALDASP